MSSSTSSSSLTDLKRFVFRIIVFGISLFLVLEIFFRTVLLASNPPHTVFNSEFNMMMFNRQYGETGVSTYGRYAKKHTLWRINNVGWPSLFDYSVEHDDGRSRVALIGDSYVLGTMIDVNDHLDVNLCEMFDGNIEVYTFGQVSTHLAQNVAIAQYVEIEYSPDIYIIFVNQDDIKNSIKPTGKSLPFYYQICEDIEDNSFNWIEPIPRPSSSIREFMHNSALARYFRHNVGLSVLGVAAPAPEGRKAEIGIPDQDGQESSLRNAALFLINELHEKIGGKPVIFVLDGPRAQIYEPEMNTSRFEDCQIILELCRAKYNCYTIDLICDFSIVYAQDLRRFDYEDDPHWNSYGSFVVADIIQRFLYTNGLVF